MSTNKHPDSRLVTLTLLFAISTWSQSALAYIDPVNGAMMLQLLLSGVAGGVVVFRRIIRDSLSRIKDRWKTIVKR